MSDITTRELTDDRTLTEPYYREDVFLEATDEESGLVLSAYRYSIAGQPKWYGLALGPMSFDRRNKGYYDAEFSVSAVYGGPGTMDDVDDEQRIIDYATSRFHEELGYLITSGWTHRLPDTLH